MGTWVACVARLSDCQSSELTKVIVVIGLTGVTSVTGLQRAGNALKVELGIDTLTDWTNM